MNLYLSPIKYRRTRQEILAFPEDKKFPSRDLVSIKQELRCGQLCAIGPLKGVPKFVFRVGYTGDAHV
jgi:hypothetical protein